MILYIHSHEIADRGYTFGRHYGYPRGVNHIVVPDGTTVTGITTLVQSQVGASGKIDLLIFNGHGNNGSIYFGDWIDAEDALDFSPLADLMNQFANGVELHCCFSAAGDLSLLRAMHEAFGTKIVAPFGAQLGRLCYENAGPPCLPIDGDNADYTGVFEGPIAIITREGAVIQQTVSAGSACGG